MHNVLRRRLAGQRVRDMDAYDVDQVTALLHVLPGLYPCGDEWLVRRLRDVLEGNADCKLVEREGRIVAAAILTPKSAGVVKLSTFFVAEDCRHLGVGAELLRTVLNEVDRAGVRELYVTVAHHLAQPLVALFGPHGFTRTAFERDRYGLGRHELVLSRLSL